MRIALDGVTPLVFDDGSPVRAASGLSRYGEDWLVVQDDATHACLWRDGAGRRLRLLAPVQGHDVFDEASGTKALKPDLEAVVALPDGRTLVLGSGSTPARMRSVLLSPESVVVVALPAVYERVAEALGVAPDQLNLEGACVVGSVLRWFQRGLPPAGVPTGSVDVDLDALLALVAGRPAAGAVGAVRRYDLGGVAGVGLAVTDAVALGDGRVLVSAVAEGSRSTYDDGPVVGSALALLDGEALLDVTPLPTVEGTTAKVEGLALASTDEEELRLVGVTDADDPRRPSQLLDLRVTL